eukprot:4651407-Lingulodinium_polyedra.AAC.1
MVGQGLGGARPMSGQCSGDARAMLGRWPGNVQAMRGQCSLAEHPTSGPRVRRAVVSVNRNISST